MRVVCIDDKEQDNDFNYPTVKKGNIYTVIDSQEEEKGSLGKYSYPEGVYYQLAEMGTYIYHSSLFLPINEDQQDEVEMQRDYKQLTTQ